MKVPIVIVLFYHGILVLVLKFDGRSNTKCSTLEVIRMLISAITVDIAIMILIEVLAELVTAQLGY